MQLLINAMKCDSELLRHVGYCLVVCILLINVANGNQVSPLKEEAEYLVFSFLDYANQLEGANLVGGPFSISYVTLQLKEDKKNTYIYYTYDAPLPAPGYPHGFEVVVESGISEHIRTILSEPVQSYKDNLSKQIVNILETFRNDHTSSKDLLEYVSIHDNQITRRWKEPGHYVYSFRKINNREYQILFCRPFSENTPFFYEERQKREVLCFDAEQNLSDFADECSSFTDEKITSLSNEQKFLLFGKFSDDELLKYYKAIKNSLTNEKFIMAMERGSYAGVGNRQEAFVTVYYGRPEYLFPFYSLVVEEIDGEWKVLRSLSLQSDPIRLCPNSAGPVSFREKVPSELIAKFAATLHTGNPPEEKFSPNEVITESDLLYISEVVLRLRGIEDYCDFRIDNYNAHEINVIIGRYPHTGLSFQKHYNDWLLVNYSS